MEEKLNCGDKESWVKDGWKYCKISQGLMLKKMYPEYVVTDYVLWIVTDLYFETDMLDRKPDIRGIVQVVKKDGTKIEFTSKVKNPYPNKRLHQVIMMNGRKRGFGIPLIFKTFEELAEIEEIAVTWTIDFFDKENTVFASQVYEEFYHVQFLEDKEKQENRVYTLSSRNILGLGMFETLQSDNEEHIFEFLANFDRTTMTELDSEKGYVEREVLYQPNKKGKIVSKIKSIESLSYKSGLARLATYITENAEHSISLYKVTIEKKECLDAHYMANLHADTIAPDAVILSENNLEESEDNIDEPKTQATDEIDIDGEPFSLICKYDTGNYSLNDWEVTSNKIINMTVNTKNLPEDYSVYIEHVHADMLLQSTSPQINGITQDTMDDSDHRVPSKGFPISDSTSYNNTFAIEGYTDQFYQLWGHAFGTYGGMHSSYERLTEENIRNVGTYAEKLVVVYDIIISTPECEEGYVKSVYSELLIPLN